MSLCVQHAKRREYCYQCCHESKGYQNVIVDQLFNRLDKLWESSSDDARKLMLDVEQRYPLTGVRILAHGDHQDKSSGSLEEVWLDALSLFTEMRLKHPGAELLLNNDGFYIYIRGSLLDANMPETVTS